MSSRSLAFLVLAGHLSVWVLGLMMLGLPLQAETFNVNSTADVLYPPAGTVTLRSAIQAANASPGGNIINLTMPGTYKITSAGVDPGDNSSGAFAVLPGGGDLTIINTSGGAVIVDGNQIDRVFTINPQAATTAFNVSMNGFTITNGSAENLTNPDGPDASGGGIRVAGPVNLTLTDMTVTNNQATADGGGISMENTFSPVGGWTLTLNNTMMIGNRAGDSGGGVDTDGSGSVFLNAGTMVSNNTAVNFGGGIFLDSIQAGTVFESANLSLQNTVVNDNRVLGSTGAGGGIANSGNGNVAISKSTIENNNSAGIGGGYADQNGQATLSISGSAFLNNVATGNGGGIAAGGSSVAITQSEIDGNTSSGMGGGWWQIGVKATVTQSTFAHNAAAQGGGMELAGTGTTSIVNSTVTGNSIVSVTATGSGGGMDFNSAGMVTLQNDTISGNDATVTRGGGIFWEGVLGSLFSIQNTIVAGNTSFSGPDVGNAAGTFIDNGGNLIGVSGPSSGNTGFTAASTQTGTVANPLNPLLGPLANNGGPTLTLALLTGSPAIDKAVTNALTVDQRGVSRPQGSGYDVGAYEFNVGSTPTANLSVLNLDFGDLGVGVPASQTVTLTNTGTGGLALSALALSGADATDFAITPAPGCALPVTVAASQACGYAVTFTPAALGPRTTSLTFTDDTVNAPGSTQTVALVGNGIALRTTTTSLSLTSGTSPTAFGGSLTFTATVIPGTASGMMNFFDGGTTIGAVPLSGGSAPLTTSSLAAGNHSITAQYQGDTFNSASTSSVLQQVVAPVAGDFTISANPATATVAAGGSATFTFTITPENGFTQSVTFLCAGLPSATTCNFAPASITLSNAAATSTLTITTTAPTTARLRGPGTGKGPVNTWLSWSGVLVGCLWLTLGSRPRAGASARWPLALVLALVTIAGTTVSLTGCGGNTTTVTKTLTPGTPAGTSQVTVLASGASSGHTVAVTLTVQ